MIKLKIRYYIEHILFPKVYYKDPLKVITKLLTEKEEYIYEFYLNAYEEAKEACPFMQEHFKVEVSQIDQIEFISITLPDFFIEPTMCHKIVLAYSMNMDLYQYYTLEDGNDPLFGNYIELCAWMEGVHVNFGDVKPEEDVIKKINQTILM